MILTAIMSTIKSKVLKLFGHIERSEVGLYFAWKARLKEKKQRKTTKAMAR